MIDRGEIWTNQKIRFHVYDTTPWLILDIHRDFPVGGGWGLGWAKAGQDSLKIC